MLLALVGADPDSVLRARAEELLSGGRLQEARALLERGLRSHPRDPALLMLLGRVHLDWPVIGRHRAWSLFGEAARLSPADPAPRYLQMQTGLRLGGNDGESMARDAIYAILAIDPDYRDVWAIWNGFFKGGGQLRRAADLLSRHHGALAARRRAGLLIELEQYQSADSVLERLTEQQPNDPGPWALRAQAALERGDTARGVEWYDRAVARSARDTAGILWNQIQAIASPEEEGDYAVTAPAGRPAFLRAFWNRREPDLTTPVNERLPEHFARLRAVRNRFRLLHPRSTFHRSAEWRALQGGAAGAVRTARQDFGTASDLLPGRSVFEEEIQSLGLGVDARDLPEPDTVTRYARHGLDGRGLLYLRFGEPKQWTAGRDLEAWRYDVDGRMVSLVIARATATAAFTGGVMMGGDFIIYPTSRVEVHNAVLMLERDQTSIAAPLSLAAWTAFFRGADATDVIINVAADTAAVALWDAADREVARARLAPPVVVAARQGAHRFGADARIENRLGRVRGQIDVPFLAPEWLAVSSVLVGVIADTAPDRLTMARTMPADLVIRRENRPLSLYLEVYDLPERNGMAEYGIEYAFEPVDGGRRVTFAFGRQAAAGATIIERLTIQPDQIAPGRYRLTITVRDRVLGLRARAASVTVTLR